ncbi:CDGSH iron-sulfur domain-containing protein [Kitasatospora sp. NPDC094028]
MVLPGGEVRASERPVVALCVCRRSRCYPFCDTSHRRHARRERRSTGDGSSARRSGSDGSGGAEDGGLAQG